jgi:hypothetical protein
MDSDLVQSRILSVPMVPRCVLPVSIASHPGKRRRDRGNDLAPQSFSYPIAIAEGRHITQIISS